MRRLDMTLLLTLVLAVTGPAVAQEPPAPTPATAPEALPGATDATRPPLDVELETGGYSYSSGGRRDPFVSLQRPVAADRGPRFRRSLSQSRFSRLYGLAPAGGFGLVRNGDADVESVGSKS